MREHWLGLFLALLWLPAAWAFADPAAVETTYRTHCAQCHGENRLGGIGPALLPESLERLRQPEALKVIREGRVATQMPAFGEQLGEDETRQLAVWIYRPMAPSP
ncbi:MAG TPA: cytochrome c, partial [Accumulibacter sp.]|nr:cytochrome c [Accumulibacter sp.]